ncbi:MAG TPA: endonuclease/exonuclease/phosphatase family protein [Vicinamibacterales bacterium]|nr:endonuclease/exonuclease/phosphatase family protein [Vicinamibacterales bacterium]
MGSPVYIDRPSIVTEPPSLDQLAVISWNAHLADGELPALVNDLKSGELTGQPVQHFVLLVQELYRRGVAVPEFDPRDRTAFAIKPRDPESLDIDDHAASLGLSVLYVPSMRNGAGLREDRGNAILSTERLLDPVALELPLARQRRVALAAAIDVRTADGVRRLRVVDAHLEPLSSPRTLWVFKDPRPTQVRALLSLLQEPAFADDRTAGIVIGGDFNTVRSGDAEEAYRLIRRWSTSLAQEDRRDTHLMGRLDYVFFRAANGWVAQTRRLDERFGSDHYPVLATFSH